MTYLEHICACNHLGNNHYLPFCVENSTLGWIRDDRVAHLHSHADLIAVHKEYVSFAEKIPASGYEAAMDTLVDRLIEREILTPKRHELYTVAPRLGAPSLFRMDRSAITFFGIAACGVHLNGFVRTKDGVSLWIGKRAMDRLIEPGKLDNIVAGGQPAGLSFQENLLKEAAEEASMPPELARQAYPTGTVRYTLETGTGLRRDTLFCFDIDLSDGFVPKGSDGETESFLLLPVEEVCRLILETQDFKFNVPLVIIDFLIRHGHLTADNEKDYPALCAGLHSPEHPMPL